MKNTLLLDHRNDHGSARRRRGHLIDTQGGWFGGNALYLLKGKPAFATAASHYPEHKYRVERRSALAPGKHDAPGGFRL